MRLALPDPIDPVSKWPCLTAEEAVGVTSALHGRSTIFLACSVLSPYAGSQLRSSKDHNESNQVTPLSSMSWRDSRPRDRYAFRTSLRSHSSLGQAVRPCTPQSW